LAALEYSKYPLSWVRLGSFSIAFAMGRRWGWGKGILRVADGLICWRIITGSSRCVVFHVFFRRDPPTKICVFW
jgi:hypothetical protein